MSNIESKNFEEENISGSEKLFDTPEKIDAIRQRTFELVDKIADQKIDMLIFMDKSARPISWMLKAAWGKTEKTKAKKLPQIRYTNIGQEKLDMMKDDYREVTSYETFERRYEKEDLIKKKNKINNEGTRNIIQKMISQIEQSDKVKFKDYWEKYDKQLIDQGYFSKLKQSINDDKKTKNQTDYKIMIVDDWVESGRSRNIAINTFKYQFLDNPDISISFHDFFKKKDQEIFSQEYYRGIYLPWHTNEKYTLVKEQLPEKKLSLTSAPESDPQKRQSGLKLLGEIETIFSKHQSSTKS
ncbi:MAG: hypothetical protein WC570_00895 [Patescibacteria group bacterium]